MRSGKKKYIKLEEEATVNAIKTMVDGFFKDKGKSELWFKTLNPLLGNMTPDQLIKLGRTHVVLKFVEHQLADNEPPPGLKCTN